MGSQRVGHDWVTFTLSHFEFFFVWCEWVSRLHWFTSNCLAFPVPLSSIVYSCLLCRRLIDFRCAGLIWAFYSIPSIYTSVFVPVLWCFDYCSFVVLFEIWEDYWSFSSSVSNSVCVLGCVCVFEPMTCCFSSCHQALYSILKFSSCSAEGGLGSWRSRAAIVEISDGLNYRFLKNTMQNAFSPGCKVWFS